MAVTLTVLASEVPSTTWAKTGLHAAVPAGDQVIAFVYELTASGGTYTYLADGLPITPTLEYSQPVNSERLRVVVFAPNLVEGMTVFTVTTDGGENWGYWEAQVSGASMVAPTPPYAYITSTGNPTSPAFVSTDLVGLAVVGMMADPAGTYTTPGSMTDLFAWTAGGVDSDTAKFPIAAVGVIAAIPWTGTSSTAFVSILLPFYAVSVQVPSAYGYSSASAVTVVTPGSVPEPIPVAPFQPAINPLPPNPSDIVVPLEPWIPKPGPYREKSH